METTTTETETPTDSHSTPAEATVTKTKIDGTPSTTTNMTTATTSKDLGKRVQEERAATFKSLGLPEKREARIAAAMAMQVKMREQNLEKKRSSVATRNYKEETAVPDKTAVPDNNKDLGKRVQEERAATFKSLDLSEKKEERNVAAMARQAKKREQNLEKRRGGITTSKTKRENAIPTTTIPLAASSAATALPDLHNNSCTIVSMPSFAPPQEGSLVIPSSASSAAAALPDFHDNSCTISSIPSSASSVVIRGDYYQEETADYYQEETADYYQEDEAAAPDNNISSTTTVTIPPTASSVVTRDYQEEIAAPDNNISCTTIFTVPPASSVVTRSQERRKRRASERKRLASVEADQDTSCETVGIPLSSAPSVMTRNQAKRIAAFKDRAGIAQRKEERKATAMDYQNKSRKKNRKKSLDQKRHGTTPMQQRKEGPMEKGPMQEEEQGQIHDNADDDDDDDAFINKLASDLDDSYHQEVWDAVFKKGVDDLDDDLTSL